MIAEKIDSVTCTLQGLGGHVHPEVYALLRHACAELKDAASCVRHLEAAHLPITEPVAATQNQ